MPNHLAGGAELRADEFRFPYKRLENDVFLALLINEIAAPDLRRRLQFSVDTSVPLLQARRIPGQVDDE